MGSRLGRRLVVSVAGALIAFGASLLVFTHSTWALRPRPERLTGKELTAEAEVQAARRVQGPATFARPEGLSPLAGIKPVWELPATKRAHTIETPLGLVDPAEVGRLRGLAPSLAGPPGRALGPG
ncbi:MAG TPA: hypothetical protein VFT43_04940, partial [Candidatus Polarisedimenticolia bacterium]|nr:hypothetical protein [Candidatus Polarisedimenticolia bacterium]